MEARTILDFNLAMCQWQISFFYFWIIIFSHMKIFSGGCILFNLIYILFILLKKNFFFTFIHNEAATAFYFNLKSLIWFCVIKLHCESYMLNRIRCCDWFIRCICCRWKHFLFFDEPHHKIDIMWCYNHCGWRLLLCGKRCKKCF